MSVIRKKPFIKDLIDDLTAQQKTTLLNVINGEKDLVNASFANMPADAITPVLFKLSESDSKTGILVLSSHFRVLICYHRFQDLLMIKLNSNNTYEKINEYLDINELRRLVEEADDHIVASEIDSGAATADQVLAADGDGGVEWKNLTDTITEDTVTEGDAIKLFGFDAQGNLVSDDIPEGITVDETIIEDSPNAVAGGAVYDALADIDAELETKANVDGNYPTMTVGVADQLSPYDDESGDDQDEPFSFQATGTGNGSQPDFSTGAIALLKEKQGNTVCVNQLVSVLPATTTVNGITFTNNGDGSVTISGTATATADYDPLCYLNKIGHTYLVFAGDDRIQVRISGLGGGENAYIGLLSQLANVYLRVVSGVNFNSPITIRPFVVDLTQWFNGDIPQDLLDNPSNFYRYYQGSLAYNAGELVNANGRYIKCIGRQQWDEEVLADTTISGTDGDNDSVPGSYCSKNYMPVIPNGTYYNYAPNYLNARWYDAQKNYIGYSVLSQNSTFTVPSNACYLRFNLLGAYQNNITISIYYDGESGYDQYYPYQVLTNNDTGTETLRSSGSVKDTKAPDGTITRRIASVDLSTLSWGYDSTYGFFYYGTSSSGSIIPKIADSTQNIVCSKYNFGGAKTDAQMASAENGVYSHGYYIYLKDTSLQSTDTPTGILYYELDEPTTEQGTPFSENLVIDDFGSMDFQGANGVPQGNLIFYPVDYKAFIDTLYDYTEGTPSELALKSDLSADKSELQGVDTQLLNAIGGTLRHLLVANNSGLSFLNTAYVDLGSVGWTKGGSSFSTTGFASLLKIPESSETPKLLASSEYLIPKSANAVSGVAGSYEIYITPQGQLIWYYPLSAFADGDAFMNAMKGVLLAYEKA